jgi:hypothetical protein
MRARPARPLLTALTSPVPGQEDSIKVRFNAWPRAPATPLIRIVFSTFPALLADHLPGCGDTAEIQGLPIISIAKAIEAIDPETVACDLGRQPAVLTR